MTNSSASVKRILVVEDEPAICEVCLRVLTSERFEVDIAANGELAQAKLQEKDDYTLILIDIRTPVMNGKELYQWIKEKYPELTNGVIFTTGDMMGGDTQSFLEMAGRPFLPKPFTPDELRTTVQQALSELEK